MNKKSVVIFTNNHLLLNQKHQTKNRVLNSKTAKQPILYILCDFWMHNQMLSSKIDKEERDLNVRLNVRHDLREIIQH